MKLRRILASVIAGACVFGASAEVKYVFYLIGDGMGMGHVNAAQYYNRMVRGADEPILMMQFPVASQAWTYSASSPGHRLCCCGYRSVDRQQDLQQYARHGSRLGDSLCLHRS